MKFFNLHTFLLISGLLFISQHSYAMEQPYESTKLDLFETRDSDYHTETFSNTAYKKAKTSVKFIYDENGDFYREQIFPFVKEQKSALNLRFANKSVNKAFCDYSKKYKPIRLITINKFNYDEFINFLKINKSIDFCVALELSDFENLEKKVSKASSEILSLFGNKITELNLQVLDINLINPNHLEKDNIRKLKIFCFENLNKNFFEKLLPKKLESLIIDCESINDDFLENLPLTLKCLDLSQQTSITGQFLKNNSMPQLEKLKLYVSINYVSINYVSTNEENLEYLPKNLKILYVNHTNIKNYSWLKKLQNLTKLCVNNKFCDKDFKDLPQSLITLDLEEVTDGGDFRDNRITCEGFKDLPKQLKFIKFFSLIKMDKKYLSDLPKSIRKVYIKDDYCDVVNNDFHQEKIAIIRKMGIRVVDKNGEDFPDHKDEPRISHDDDDQYIFLHRF
jgi:hypothetical protein